MNPPPPVLFDNRTIRRRRSFDQRAPLGRFMLMFGAYGPVLAILGLRIGFTAVGFALLGAAALGAALWSFFLLDIAEHRQRRTVKVKAASTLDSNVAAYVASYLLPVLAAKTTGTSTYIAYGLAAALILVVAYRADLGTINPLAYIFGYRAYSVTIGDDTVTVLSKWLLEPNAIWDIQTVAGIVIARIPRDELAAERQARAAQKRATAEKRTADRLAVRAQKLAAQAEKLAAEEEKLATEDETRARDAAERTREAAARATAAAERAKVAADDEAATAIAPLTAAATAAANSQSDSA